MSLAQLLPCDDDAARQRRPVEPDALSQDLCAGQLRDAFSLGERGGRLLEIDAIDFDPSPARLHERSRLTGQAPDLVGRQFDVVEQHRPGDVAELMRADDRPAVASANSRSEGGPCGETAQAVARRTRPSPASGPTTVMNSTPRPG